VGDRRAQPPGTAHAGAYRDVDADPFAYAAASYVYTHGHPYSNSCSHCYTDCDDYGYTDGH
jgi:hypothetical protein